jgi:uncharacterized protein
MSRFLVLAKAPVAGRVKTRLCPPCTPEQAALVAGASLAATLETVTACRAGQRVLVIDGGHPAPTGWMRMSQRGLSLGERLANAFADASAAGPAVLVGMDTPQMTRDHLDQALELITSPAGPDAALGMAADGGWWILGLRDPRDGEILRGIATSTATTGADTLAAMRSRGLRIASLATLRDVDYAEDAHFVAAQCPPGGRFATTVALEVPMIAAGVGS